MAKVVVKSAENGPNLVMIGDKTATALCRCGHSGKMPYCDGAHRTCGFTAPAAEVKILD